MDFISNLTDWLAAVIRLYTMALFIRIILTWIPSIDWYRQPFAFLHSVTEPPLQLARGIIPPIGMLDLSPIVVFLVLSIVEGILRAI